MWFLSQKLGGQVVFFSSLLVFVFYGSLHVSAGLMFLAAFYFIFNSTTFVKITSVWTC